MRAREGTVVREPPPDQVDRRGGEALGGEDGEKTAKLQAGGVEAVQGDNRGDCGGRERGCGRVCERWKREEERMEQQGRVRPGRVAEESTHAPSSPPARPKASFARKAVSTGPTDGMSRDSRRRPARAARAAGSSIAEAGAGTNGANSARAGAGARLLAGRVTRDDATPVMRPLAVGRAGRSIVIGRVCTKRKE